MESRRVVMELRPHPLAFAGLYVFWLYVAGVSLAVWRLQGALESRVEGLPLLGSIASGYAAAAVWFLLIFVPALVYSVARISWRYAVAAALLGLGGPAVLHYALGEIYPHIYYLGIAVGLLGMASVEMHRRAHRFLVTERGLVMEYRGAKHVRREILYSRITDLVMEKSGLGKVFGFGNIIPVTASGIGTGEDASGLIAGVGASRGVGAGIAVSGGRVVSVPRTRSYYMLFAVPHPEKVYDAIVEAMRSAEEAPYLKKILEELRGEKGSGQDRGEQGPGP